MILRRDFRAGPMFETYIAEIESYLEQAGHQIKSWELWGTGSEWFIGIFAGIIGAFSAAFLTTITTMPAARAQMSTSGAVVVTNGPQINPGDRSGSWSAQQNVRDSERYEAVVHANSSFRVNRISKECGPINDPQLHANCVASFGQ